MKNGIMNKGLIILGPNIIRHIHSTISVMLRIVFLCVGMCDDKYCLLLLKQYFGKFLPIN